jgi:hypothetical protein
VKTAKIILLLVLSSASFGQLAYVRQTSHGSLHRAWAARAQFQREHPCPATGTTSGSCPGWIVDHVIPLVCGGPDKPSNMAWQTVKDAKEKDKVERKNCEDKRTINGKQPLGY